MDIIQKLARDVTERLGSAAASAESKSSAIEALEGIAEEIELLLQPDGEEDFVLRYLHRERVLFQTDDLDELPDYIEGGELREDPLCSCHNPDCDVKKARIPASVRKAATLQKGLRRFKQEHSGYPQALDEGFREYRRTAARVHQELRVVYAALGSDVTVDSLRSQAEGISADPGESADDEGETANV